MGEEFNRDLLDQINKYAKATGADPNRPVNIQIDDQTAQSGWHDFIFSTVANDTGAWVETNPSQQDEPKRELKEGEDYEVIE